MGIIRYGRTAQIGVYPGNQWGGYISYRGGGGFPLDPDVTAGWLFAKNKNLIDEVSGLELTFSRGSNATYYDAAGNLQIAAPNEPRFDHDPVTKESLGLLIEEARTNFFLDSDNPATQGITTTAQDYSISVWGSGDITLSGSATGVVTEGNPLTVTATAGTLTCTVNGSLDRAQVEAGGFPTSYIPTPVALDVTATRAVDNCRTTDMSWYNSAGPGTFYIKARLLADPVGYPERVMYRIVNGTDAALQRLNNVTGGHVGTTISSAGSGQSGVLSGPAPAGRAFKSALAIATDDAAQALDGAINGTDATIDPPQNVTILTIGRGPTTTSGILNAHIDTFGYANVRKDNTFLEDLTTP